MGMTGNKISRRSFVGGTAALAGTAAMAAAAEASASEASSQDDVAQGKGRWSWSVKPAPIDDAAVDETVDCEILVCGYGSAGVPATVYAAAMGADVVTITAGDGPEAEGAYCAAYNSPLDEEYGIPAYDAAYWKRRLVMEGVGAVEMPADGPIYDRSGDAMNWFAEYLSDAWPYSILSDMANGGGDGIHNNAGDPDHGHVIYIWPDTSYENATIANYMGFPQLLAAADKRAQEDGARILFSTPLRQLITDGEGNVTGAFAQKADGGYVRINASKGVLLATGDFHQNDEMLECFAPEMCGDLHSRNPYGFAQGDGHKAALWAGAHLDAGSYGFGLCWPHDFEYTQYAPQAWSNVPYLRVNSKGERYVNEELATHELYSTSPLCLADCRQPGHIGFQILDSKYGNLLDAELFERCVENGVVYKADTLEELADQVGIDREGLLATVARYNELCANGYDEDAGVNAEYLPNTSVTEAPFYCLPHEVQKQAVMGGVRTNEREQVYSADHEVMGGLYAAGLIRSGFCGPHYSWSGFTGSNKMNAMVGGMLAVKAILGTWDEEFGA